MMMRVQHRATRHRSSSLAEAPQRVKSNQDRGPFSAANSVESMLRFPTFPERDPGSFWQAVRMRGARLVCSSQAPQERSMTSMRLMILVIVTVIALPPRAAAQSEGQGDQPLASFLKTLVARAVTLSDAPPPPDIPEATVHEAHFLAGANFSAARGELNKAMPSSSPRSRSHPRRAASATPWTRRLAPSPL
jgi:hypothetical protein